MWQQQQPVDSVLQHVSSLHQYFPGRVTELAPRQSYRLDVFIARAAMNLTFMINFSPTFPVVPPSIAVQPALSHAWVDGNMNVYGHPSLLSWNGAVLVGKIIKDVELEFSLRPPMVLPQAPRTAPQAPAAREEAVSFPEVDLKTQNELMEMLEDESKFIAFFETTKAFKKAKKVLSELESQNIELARGNMALLQEAQDLSGNLSSSLAVLEEQEEKSKRIFTQNKSLLDKYSQRSVLSIFVRKCDLANQESDGLFDLFLSSSEGDAGSFFRKYKDMRSLFHQRSLHKEKIKQLKA